MSKSKHIFKIVCLFVLFCVVIVILFRASPISQDKSYHQFSDTRALFGVPHFANIASNFLLIILAIWGIAFLFFSKPLFFHYPKERNVWMIFFGGSIFAGLGSMFYHWNPSNISLAVDRLFLSIVFMTFFSLMIIERIDFRVGLRLFPWLILAGVSSVLYWIFTESLSQGDLRPYIIIQFFPLLAIPLILLFFPASYRGQKWLWASLASYVVGKVFELTDRKTLEFFQGQLSGHTLKHFFLGVSLFFIIIYLKNRKIKTR